MCKLACCMIVLLLLLSVIALAEPIQVTIDILPGECPNVVYLGEQSSVPLAIQTTDMFKATAIDVDTIRLAGVSPSVSKNHGGLAYSKQDVDHDGDRDLVVWFPLEQLPLVYGEQTLILTGEMRHGGEIVGSDNLVGTGPSTPIPGYGAMAGNSPEVSTASCDGGILIGWNDISYMPTASIIEYHVYRALSLRFDGSLWTTCLWPDTWGFTIPLSLNPSAAPPHTGPAGSFVHSAIDDETTRTVECNQPNLDGGLSHWTTTAYGIIRGIHYEYEVSCVYLRQDGVYIETWPVYVGQATYLTRPVPVSPNSRKAVHLSDVTFQWQGSKGANRYAIEVSPSPSFPRESTWVSATSEDTAADGDRVSRTFTNVLNNAAELAGITPGSTLYWRVGARNATDRPGPYPAGPSPLAEGEKNTRYIYNSAENVLSFTVGDSGGGPPSPPPL